MMTYLTTPLCAGDSSVRCTVRVSRLSLPVWERRLRRLLHRPAHVWHKPAGKLHQPTCCCCCYFFPALSVMEWFARGLCSDHSRCVLGLILASCPTLQPSHALTCPVMSSVFCLCSPRFRKAFCLRRTPRAPAASTSPAPAPSCLAVLGSPTQTWYATCVRGSIGIACRASVCMQCAWMSATMTVMVSGGIDLEREGEGRGTEIKCFVARSFVYITVQGACAFVARSQCTLTSPQPHLLLDPARLCHCCPSHRLRLEDPGLRLHLSARPRGPSRVRRHQLLPEFPARKRRRGVQLV
jgi:hypothetical protein